MTKTFEGIFENGYVVFKEKPEIPKNAKVLVVFEEKDIKADSGKRELGTMRGQFEMADDFDEPLTELEEFWT